MRMLGRAAGPPARSAAAGLNRTTTSRGSFIIKFWRCLSRSRRGRSSELRRFRGLGWPVIRAEGGSRQACPVEKVAVGDVLPGVPDRLRGFHIGAGNHDFIADDPGGGGMPDTVFARDEKPFERFAALGREGSVGVFE